MSPELIIGISAAGVVSMLVIAYKGIARSSFVKEREQYVMQREQHLKDANEARMKLLIEVAELNAIYRERKNNPDLEEMTDRDYKLELSRLQSDKLRRYGEYPWLFDIHEDYQAITDE